MNETTVLKHLIDKQLVRIEGLTSSFDKEDSVRIELNKEKDRPIIKISQPNYTYINLDFLQNTREDVIQKFSDQVFDNVYIQEVKRVLEDLGFSVVLIE